MKAPDLTTAGEIRAKPTSGGSTRGWYKLPSGGYVEAVMLRKLCRLLPDSTDVIHSSEGVVLRWGRGRIRLWGVPGYRLEVGHVPLGPRP